MSELPEVLMENTWPLRNGVSMIWIDLDRSDILKVFKVSNALFPMSHLGVLDGLLVKAQPR